jgi:hypothetical protein
MTFGVIGSRRRLVFSVSNNLKLSQLIVTFLTGSFLHFGLGLSAGTTRLHYGSCARRRKKLADYRPWANLQNESTVANACQDRGEGKHRFMVMLPYGCGPESKIDVHGIRPAKVREFGEIILEADKT